jgi:hypothetical protein
MLGGRRYRCQAAFGRLQRANVGCVCGLKAKQCFVQLHRLTIMRSYEQVVALLGRLLFAKEDKVRYVPLFGIS